MAEDGLARDLPHQNGGVGSGIHRFTARMTPA
jgi:hypothetical protein